MGGGRRVCELLAERGAPLPDSWHTCRHAEEERCGCRKPMPGLLHEALDEHGAAAADTWMISDAAVDVGAGSAAGCRTIALARGRDNEAEARRAPDAVCADLRTAAVRTLQPEARSDAVAGRWDEALGRALRRTQTRRPAGFADDPARRHEKGDRAPAPVRHGMDAAVEAFGDLWTRVRDRGGFAWWCGNGGSWTACAHAANDLAVRGGLPSAMLGDAGAVTAAANDNGWTGGFDALVRSRVRFDDLLMIVSSSGESANLSEAAKAARARGANIATLSGFGYRNALYGLDGADVASHVPARDYGIVETAHLALLHAAVDDFAAKRRVRERGDG